jgi:hypothetical protein
MENSVPGTVIPSEWHGTGSGVLNTVEASGSKTHVVAMEGHPACFWWNRVVPSPPDFVLASLVACRQVTGKIVATGIKGAELGKWDIVLTSNLDNSVLVYGEQGIPTFAT